jgi:hypothetical protein
VNALRVTHYQIVVHDAARSQVLAASFDPEHAPMVTVRPS